jgi:hypothetical protein
MPAKISTSPVSRPNRFIGSIVCMHDGRPPDEPAELSAPTREQSVAAVGMILEAMTERGLRSVTISELLAA